MPSAPAINIVAHESHPVYAGAVATWSPLGFYAAAPDAQECADRWFEGDDTSCVITVQVERVAQLRERVGTDALAQRAENLILVDARITNQLDLLIAVAHELGHIILDTAEHTAGGVMGGASSQLMAVDYELACRVAMLCSSR